MSLEVRRPKKSGRYTSSS